jgi:integrase/recombinase XerC
MPHITEPRVAANGSVVELVRHFLSNRAATTLKAYRADLDSFAAFLGSHSSEEAMTQLLKDGRGNANAIALRWLAQMREDELATSTRARRISTLRSVVALARLIGVVDWELEVRAPAIHPVKDVRGPNISDVSRMLDSCGDGLHGTRDRALLLIAITMGLRRSEIAALQVGDYDRSRSMLLIHGKGERKTWMKVPAKTVQSLEEWICLSRGAFCSPESVCSLPLDRPIFFRLDRGLDIDAPALSPDGVYDIVRRAGSTIGRHVWPHALRHAAITAALNATGGDVRKVQQFSRHSTPAMVMRYDDASAEDLADTTSRAVSDLLFSGDDDE